MELNDDIKKIKGVGPKKAEALSRLGIRSLEDLLYHFPRDYEDRRIIKNIANLLDQETVMIRGVITLMVKSGFYGKKRTLKLLVEDSTGSIEVIFFQAAYLEKTLQKGMPYEFFGKVQNNRGRWQMVHPDFHRYIEGAEQKILPVYPLAAGVSQSDLRKLQKTAQPVAQGIEEYIPAEIIERNRLCGIQYALKNIHFPTEPRMVKEARYRLVFEELLLLQLGLLMTKNRFTDMKEGTVFSKDVSMEEFTATFPYSLTDAQRRVLSEINEDMESAKVMNRLVQGDVGSGKTAVAATAIYKAVKSGFQAVMMAPTEILARQHYEELKKQFEPFGLQTAFLSGSVGAKAKKEILSFLEEGEIHILIGTHAVIQENVKFKNLGLVITDEQHRFGVNQRGLLSEKGCNPDVLVMTATPIPRTLAVILYGDLDISIIDEMPKGRQTIITRTTDGRGRESAYEFLRREVAKGRQGYVVAPLIEESEELSAKSAVSVYEELSAKFPGLRVALLHGAMKQQEKDKIMKAYYDHEIDILTSTVVIEVGINVPNATVMIIENTERFGLAQLHQLRGRVGRGREQSYCILITEGKNEVAKQRAEIMKSTNDGFVIAEKDLQLRGPGEFFGTRQHGVPELKIADLVKHVKVLQEVTNESKKLLEKDPVLSSDEHQKLRGKINRTFESVETIRI